MKSIRVFIAILVFTSTIQTARPQDRVEEIKVDWQCNYYGEAPEEKIYTFSSDQEAEAAIDKILRQIGLARNFIIKAADVPNAAAAILRLGGKPIRYILYSQAFIRRVKDATRTDWSALSIMAHELGHHLQGHTLESGGSRPPIELEADEFSGFVLYRMGASLEQSQAAMIAFASERGSATHPGKRARLTAIESGWTRARDVSKGDTTSDTSKTPSSPSDPPALNTLKNTVWLVNNSTIGGHPYLRKYESGGRVRTMTPIDRQGYYPTNITWYLSKDTVSELFYDAGNRSLLLTECKGRLKGDDIEGTCKDISTGSTRSWLLTKFIQ